MPFTFEPTATGQFIRHGTATQLSPPTVGAFLPTTNPAIALAGTHAAWLELHPRRVWHLLRAPPQTETTPPR